MRTGIEYPSDSMVGYPIVTQSGEFITETGYNVESNVFVALDKVFDTVVVPDQELTQDDIAEARNKVKQAFAHVPMSAKAESRYVAVLLTLVMRSWFDVAPLMLFVNEGSYRYDELDLYQDATFFAWDGTGLRDVRIGVRNYSAMVSNFKRCSESGHTALGVPLLDSASKKAIRDCLTLSGKKLSGSKLGYNFTLFAASDAKSVPKELKDMTLVVDTDKVDGDQDIPSWVYTHEEHEVRAEVFEGLLTLVASWIQAGQPKARKSAKFNAELSDWYKCIAGVLEHNGYAKM